jgi:hypothetical protein
MKPNTLLRKLINLIMVILFLSGCSTPAEGRFTITDFIPEVNLNETTQSRFLVAANQAGELESEVRLPSHGQEMIFFGARVTLGVGKAPFSPPPESLEMQAPSTDFTAGMINPDWFSGAEHIMIGKIALNDYVFDSDPDYPLTFKVVKEQGYVYVCGRGTITLPDNKIKDLGKSDSVASWIERSSSGEQLDREGAAQALGYLAIKGSENDRQSAVEALTGLLRDEAFEVRRDAIESLAQIGVVSAVPTLREMAEKDENEWVRRVANWAVEKLESN